VSVYVGTVASPHTFADELLEVAHEALAGAVGGQIDRRYVVHELPSVDCEMLVVVIGGITMRTLGSGELQSAQAYKSGWLNVVTYRILVARDCIPATSEAENGDPPTPEQHTATLRLCAEDVWSIWNAIPVAMAAGDLFAGRCSELMMDTATPLPVQGMAAGWNITLRTAVPGYVT
jgi:hypothetical protein